MQILLRGPDGRTVAAQCSTVADVQQAVASEFHIPAEESRLISCGLSLKEGVLAELGLVEDSAINVVLSMEGGGKKRKKKVYTKPKKIKHKKRKKKVYTKPK